MAKSLGNGWALWFLYQEYFSCIVRKKESLFVSVTPSARVDISISVRNMRKEIVWPIKRIQGVSIHFPACQEDIKIKAFTSLNSNTHMTCTTQIVKKYVVWFVVQLLWNSMCISSCLYSIIDWVFNAIFPSCVLFERR